MAYPVRQFEPHTIFFITSRTIQSRFLMAPTTKTNEFIGGILARAVRQCQVELFAYVFTSNHFHAMVRAPSATAMSKFMQRLQSNIAIKVGRLVGWRGRFFARRYSAEPIVDEGAQVERLSYILAHGVKEGLVSKSQEWPGLSCVHALVDDGRPSVHSWRNWTLRWRMEVDSDLDVDRFSSECPSETEVLELTPLPCWSALTPQERSGLVRQLVAGIDRRAGISPRETASHITEQNPLGAPFKTKHSPRPKAHASTKRLWAEAVRRYRDFHAAFRRASRAWLSGRFEVEFPLHCFRPPPWLVVARIG
ncbi:MAG TPA: transposase [Myxococcales bacterium]|jgi:REP element-mobilizing transposase RayT